MHAKIAVMTVANTVIASRDSGGIVSGCMKGMTEPSQKNPTNSSNAAQPHAFHSLELLGSVAGALGGGAK